jgi:hypothetical protein
VKRAGTYIDLDAPSDPNLEPEVPHFRPAEYVEVMFSEFATHLKNVRSHGKDTLVVWGGPGWKLKYACIKQNEKTP